MDEVDSEKNLAVPAETLEHLRQLAWLTVNRPEFVHNRTVMRVKTPEPPAVEAETPAVFAQSPTIVPAAMPALVSPSPVAQQAYHELNSYASVPGAEHLTRRQIA